MARCALHTGLALNYTPSGKYDPGHGRRSCPKSIVFSDVPDELNRAPTTKGEGASPARPPRKTAAPTKTGSQFLVPPDAKGRQGLEDRSARLQRNQSPPPGAHRGPDDKAAIDKPATKGEMIETTSLYAKRGGPIGRPFLCRFRRAE